jgi:hypothetical protein
MPGVGVSFSSGDVEPAFAQFAVNAQPPYTLPAKIGETLYSWEISVQGGEMNH